MKSIFLSHKQMFDQPLRFLQVLGAAAPASDLARMTAVDDGFLTADGGGINYYLSGSDCVDRFGRSNPCEICAVRPALLLEEGDETLLRHVEDKGSVTMAEYGCYPTTVLTRGLREMAEPTPCVRASASITGIRSRSRERSFRFICLLPVSSFFLPSNRAVPTDMSVCRTEQSSARAITSSLK